MVNPPRQAVRATRDQREHHLREQVELLLSHVDLFDAGFELAAKDMAVKLRVILYDPDAPHRRTRSLLRQLDLKESLRFVDSGGPIVSSNLNNELPLAYQRVTPSWSGLAPRLDAFQRPGGPTLKDFASWWNQDVARGCPGFPATRFTRCELVRFVADEYGGAHCDEEVSAAPLALAEAGSAGYPAAAPSPREHDIVNVCVRQIAHEVLRSLALGFPAAFAAPTQLDKYLGTVRHRPEPAGELDVADIQFIPIPETTPGSRPIRGRSHRTGRNDPCPCGSGLKYKKCCDR
jgi:hypothetical protein